MENKEYKKFSHPRWTEPLKDILKNLKNGIISQEDYDEFMNN